MTLQTILAFATPVVLYLLLGVLNLLLGHRSQIDAWAEANPRLAAVMKLSRSLGLDPWMFVQSLSLAIRGRLPATMTTAPDAVNQERVSLRPPPKPPSVPPMVAMLCLLLLFGCGGSQPDPRALIDLTPLVCRSVLAAQRLDPEQVERICADSRIGAQLAVDIGEAVRRAALAAAPALDVGGGPPIGGGAPRSSTGGSGGAP